MYYSCSNKSQQLKQCSSKMYYILFPYQHVIGINIIYKIKKLLKNDDNVMFKTPDMYVSKNISYSCYVLYLKYCIKGMLGWDKL